MEKEPTVLTLPASDRRNGGFPPTSAAPHSIAASRTCVCGALGKGRRASLGVGGTKRRSDCFQSSQLRAIGVCPELTMKMMWSARRGESSPEGAGCFPALRYTTEREVGFLRCSCAQTQRLPHSPDRC